MSHRRGLLGIGMFICIIFILIPSHDALPQKPISNSQLQALLKHYNKQIVIDAIRQLRHNYITVYAGGKYFDFLGPPSPEYVTPETIRMDLEKAGAGADDLERLVKQILKAKAKRRRAGEVLTVPQPLAKPRPRQPHPALKKAALDCDMGAFLRYMRPDTRRRVSKILDLDRQIGRVLESFYREAKGKFGDRIKRTKKGLKFAITNADDPRWNDVFPQWKFLRKMARSAHKAPTFDINVSFEWTDECEVIRSFVDCLQDEGLCGGGPRKASLRMEKVAGRWMLADEPASSELAIFAMKSSLKLLKDAKRFFHNRMNRLSYEELLVRLAGRYMDQLLSIMGRMVSKAREKGGRPGAAP